MHVLRQNTPLAFRNIVYGIAFLLESDLHPTDVDELRFLMTGLLLPCETFFRKLLLSLLLGPT